MASEYGAEVAKDPSNLPRDLDTAVVALPPRLQADVCENLLRRGVHVLCEKPIAPRAPAFAPLLGPSVSGDRLMIGFMLRLHPGLLALKCWAGGRRGVAVNARSVAHKAHVGGWRMEAEDGGVTLANSVHALDRAAWVLGETPEVIAAAGGDPMYGRPMEDYVHALLRFPDGPVVCLESFWSPFAATVSVNGSFDFRMELVARDGRLAWRNGLLTEHDARGSRRPFCSRCRTCTKSRRRCFLKTSAGGSPMPVSLADGLRATASAVPILGVLRNGGD